MASSIRVATIMRSLLINTSRTCNKATLIRSSHMLGHYPVNTTAHVNSIIIPQITSMAIRMKSSEASTGLDRDVMSKLASLDKAFARFEDRSQRVERVSQRDFIRTFDYMTKIVATLEEFNKFNEDARLNVSLSASTLLRCCGNLMSETPGKMRELLAGNLWQFMKEKNLPMDISHYNSLIRVLNDNKTDFDPQKILEEISLANLTPDRITYQRLIHRYCLQGDIGNATRLLERMKELEFELNELTFASLLIGYSKQENPPSIKEIFELMKANKVEPGSKTMAAALVSLASNVSKNKNAIDEMNSVHSMIVREELQFGTQELVDIFTYLAPLRDNESIANILEYFKKIVGKSYNNRCRIINSLVMNNHLELASELYWSEKPSGAAIESGNVGNVYIKSLASYKNVSVDFALKELLKLKETGYHRKPYHSYYFSAAENGNLDAVREALKKMAETETIKCQYYYPLLAQAKDNDEIMRVLKNDLNPGLDPNDLLETFTSWVWPKLGDNYKLVFNASQELKYNIDILVTSFLNYAIQEDKLPEAITFLTETVDDLIVKSKGTTIGATNEQADDEGGDADTNSRVKKQEPTQNQPHSRANIVARLLDQVAEHSKNPELVDKAFTLCRLSGNEINTKNTSPLVKVHLLNDNFDKALEVFLKLAEEHRVTPCSRALMTQCLIKKDPENLQKIMNVITDLRGEGNSLYDLATCCLECGKYKQAEKIFASPGFRVRTSRVYQSCEKFAQSGDITALENFVNMSRRMYDINQEYLYQVLIRTYEKTSNGERALNLWNMMQEGDFQPSKKIVLMIARVLEKNKIKVPFQKPKLSLRETKAIEEMI